MEKEKISFDEAARRGYRWIRAGWNHRENRGIYWPLGWMKSFSSTGLLAVEELEKAQAVMEPSEPDPAGDIPWASSNQAAST